MKLGSVNAYSVSAAKFGRKNFSFDGTTRGLVLASLKVGAKAGDTIEANFGGGFRPMELYANPMDDRCGGVWAR